MTENNEYELYETANARQRGSVASTKRNENCVNRLCSNPTSIILIIFGTIIIAMLAAIMAWTQMVESRLMRIEERIASSQENNYGASEDPLSSSFSTKATGITKSFETRPATEQLEQVTPPPCENNSTDNACFWISTTGERNMTYDDGVKKCNERKSYVAEVKNQKDFNLITAMLRTHWMGDGRGTYATAWINGTIDPGDPPGNSNQHPYIKWITAFGYPRGENEKTHLALLTDVKGYHYEGMVNRSPNSTVLAVACYYVWT